MKNLIIGNTSQLSYFFPEDYERISSRNIDMNYLKENEWDSVYLTFAEQRVYMGNIDYITPNYIYTKKIINNLSENTKIIIYTTSELWNNVTGCVYPDDKFNYSYPDDSFYNSYSDYCLSKENLFKYVRAERFKGRLNNVIIIHPFNFNSTYRRSDFLFGKIFNCLINKVPIEIGNTYFYRDIVHAKYMVERSIKAEKDEMVGSGRLFFINDFIRDLFEHFDMKYDKYVKENNDKKSRYLEKLFYSYQEKVYTYDMLLKDTIEDVENRINNLKK
jgi:nucleoside-diphosphate-sugar epimerase